MTEQKPNCGNCPNNIKSENRKGFRKCAITNYLLDKDFDLAKHMDDVLCLSHPGAREWLMRDVIEKLEQMAKTCGSTEQQYAYKDAILLYRMM
jgi:hypothetical protein